MDFDENRLYFSHQQLQRQDERDENGDDNEVVEKDDTDVDLKAVRRHFREFLRKYCMGGPLLYCGTPLESSHSNA